MKKLKDFLKTINEDPVNKMVDFLNNLPDEELIAIYNKGLSCEENRIHKIEHLNTVFKDMKPLDILYEASRLNFDEGFYVDDIYCVKNFGCKTYRTFSEVGDWNCPIKIKDLAKRILAYPSLYPLDDDYDDTY